jgi:hypothetical protein
MGRSYSSLTVKQINGQLKLMQLSASKADKGAAETEAEIAALPNNTFYLRVTVQKGAKCQFYYSLDDKKYSKAGSEFIASEGTWIGSKVGFAALREGTINNAGYADIDWFRISKIER